MENFINKVKTTFDKATDEAGKYSKIAIEKTSSIVNRTKLQFAANDAENKLVSVLAELGEYVYKEYSEGAEFPEDIASKCEDVDALKEEINTLLNKIADLKESKLCPECKEYNDKANLYCSRCGAKLPEDSDAEKE